MRRRVLHPRGWRGLCLLPGVPGNGNWEEKSEVRGWHLYFSSEGTVTVTGMVTMPDAVGALTAAHSLP